jgi:hypothetical protein
LGGFEQATRHFRKIAPACHTYSLGAASDVLHQPSHAMGDSICTNLQREPLNAFELSVKIIDVLGDESDHIVTKITSKTSRRVVLISIFLVLPL